MTELNSEKAPVVIDEQVVLEKVDDASGDIVERIHVSNGHIFQHDFFENGELVESKEFGGDE